MRLYVASSWRNKLQPEIVEELRAAGHEVYDFRNPPEGRDGFHWSEIDILWKDWSPAAFREGLKHPLAVEGYGSDKRGMDWAEACVLLMPCGRSAHLEAGFMAGEGKPVIVLMLSKSEPELMYKLLEGLCTSMDEVLQRLDTFSVS